MLMRPAQCRPKRSLNIREAKTKGCSVRSATKRNPNRPKRSHMNAKLEDQPARNLTASEK
jgi:hypothetical protein